MVQQQIDIMYINECYKDDKIISKYGLLSKLHPLTCVSIHIVKV